MKNVLTEFKVGIFVAAGLALAMVIIFMLGSEHQFFRRQYTLYTNFDDIAGLRVGAPVQLAGLKVGFVDDIRLSPDVDKKQITVVIKIQKEFMDRIRVDSEASIETQGLLGDKFIFVTMGSESEPKLKNKDDLKSKETTSIFALADKAGDIMNNIDDASKSIKDILDSFKGEKGEGDVKAIVSSIRKITEQAEKGKGLVHALFYDPNGEQVVDNLARALKGVGDVMQQADKEGTGSLLANMRHASADMRALMSSIRHGEGTLGKLVTDPALYNDLRALVGKANRNVLLRSVVRSTIQENERQVLK